MPTLLPLINPVLNNGPHGSRSAMTCHYRCDDACFKPMPNTSANTEFADVAAHAFARRSVVKAGAAGIGALVVSGLVTDRAAAAPATGTARGAATASVGGVATAAFEPVAPNTNDQVTVPTGYRSDVLISWGDPVTKDAPAFDVHNQSPEAAARQFGYNNDYVGVIGLRGDNAVLVCNHEYTDEQLMFPTGSYDSATIKKIAMASHGMAVVEIVKGRKAGSWRTVAPARARLNRRITASTSFNLTGPAAGDDRLRTSADPKGRTIAGTFGNCSGGTTPWGTVLSGEENFNGYFDASGPLDTRYAESYARYGISGSGKGWSEVDPRFDLTTEPHEPFRFGWIVEVDPMDPKSTPRKHSMLGRFKHEGANVTIAHNGHAVVYMGDDERGDYIYKFVSRGTYAAGRTAAARRRNLQLLTEGTLYVARFEGDGEADGVHDGTGRWIPLTSDRQSYVAGMSVADVLINTRLAADKVSPTKMDRPEDIEPNPVNGKVYCALTNNSDRGTKFPADEPNPLASSMVRPALGEPLVAKSGNRNGYLLEVTPDGADHTAETFAWDLMLVCGDPDAPETYFAGYPKQLVSPISCPDNVAFDAEGNLWISTDGNQLGSHDGLFRVPVDGPRRGHVEQFLTVPTGAETCGPLISEDQQTVFAAIQHPGEVDGATFEQPASTWPHTGAFPRPSIVVNYRA